MSRIITVVAAGGTTFKISCGECTHKLWSFGNKFRNTNSYSVKVVNVACPHTYTVFDFWASIDHPNMDEKELVSAFKCFVGDAIAGNMEFGEFCNEFGYSDPGIAYKTWNACKASYKKLFRIFGSFGGDIYDLYNELQEIEERKEEEG